MKKIDLVKVFNQYANGSEQEKKECIDKLAEFIYFNHRIFFTGDEDFVSDFFVSFFPRLPNILERYNPKLGHPYTYLLRCIKSMVFVHLRAGIYKKNRIANIENEFMSAECYKRNDSTVCEIPAEYSNTKLAKLEKAISLTCSRTKTSNYSTRKKKQMLTILICRASLDLEPNDITRLAELFDLDEQEIIRAVESIKEAMQKVNTKIEKCKEICLKSFYNAKASENCLETIDEQSSFYKSLVTKTKISKNNWYRNLTKLKSIKRTPSNRLIAEALNINRVTVQRNLEKFNKIYYNEN